MVLNGLGCRLWFELRPHVFMKGMERATYPSALIPKIQWEIWVKPGPKKVIANFWLQDLVRDLGETRLEKSDS